VDQRDVPESRDTRFFSKEICDPCEADEFGYSIKAEGSYRP